MVPTITNGERTIVITDPEDLQSGVALVPSFTKTDEYENDDEKADTLIVDIEKHCNTDALPTAAILTEVVDELIPHAWESQKFRDILTVILTLNTKSKANPSTGFAFDSRIETLLIGIGNLPTLNDVKEIAPYLDLIKVWHSEVVECSGVDHCDVLSPVELHDFGVAPREPTSNTGVTDSMDQVDINTKKNPSEVDWMTEDGVGDKAAIDVNSDDNDDEEIAVHEESKFVYCGGFAAEEVNIPPQ